tara:strand:- start:1702 stop:2121 length:420 start_codon:yes stop_codon:yes gene_type:complete
MSLQKSYLILFTLLSILITNTVHANEIFSCKLISKGRVDSESFSGEALYSDNPDERYLVSTTNPEILVMDVKNKLTFIGTDYYYLGRVTNYFYANDYWGTIEVYDFNGKEEITLFATRSDGSGSRMSNHLKVELWHCNK